MRPLQVAALCLLSTCLPICVGAGQEPKKPASILIRHGDVIDGTGASRQRADVRISGDTIVEIGQLKPIRGEQIIEAKGLVIAPGFIDAHSHADGGILEDPLAETQIRQGITTSVVGQDGASNSPLNDWFAKLESKHVALNFASFVGHGTVRNMATGKDYKRHVTDAELDKMGGLVEQEMQAGGLGLSTGLEYDPGFYSTTEELIACSKSAAKYGGIYISHMRDEGDQVFESIHELIRIGAEGGLPAQVSHIKLDTSPAWNRAAEAIGLMTDAKAKGQDVSADVYPYTYWQSTIIVLIPTRDWEDRKAWEKGLAEVGGAAHVLLSSYTPNSAWAGKTIAQIADETHQDPISVIREIVHKTHSPGATGSETVVVTAMTEADVRTFVCDPDIMFCSDGGLHGTHPRAAGSFPRVLGYYVHDLHALPLEQAIHKMTGLPAKRMSFNGRGGIAVGMKADITIFDPEKVHDTATTAHPQSPPTGIPYVIVSGQVVLEKGKFTGKRPGVVLRHVKPVN
jgi:N-acyl-D-amino-acid deacylase